MIDRDSEIAPLAGVHKSNLDFAKRNLDGDRSNMQLSYDNSKMIFS